MSTNRSFYIVTMLDQQAMQKLSYALKTNNNN